MSEKKNDKMLGNELEGFDLFQMALCLISKDEKLTGLLSEGKTYLEEKQKEFKTFPDFFILINMHSMLSALLGPDLDEKPILKEDVLRSLSLIGRIITAVIDNSGLRLRLQIPFNNKQKEE